MIGIYAPTTDGYHYSYDYNDDIIINKERIDLMKSRSNEEKSYEMERKRKKAENDYNNNLAIRGRYDKDEMVDENIFKNIVNVILYEGKSK